MYVIAYDVGTTGLKSCLFSIQKGRPIELVKGEMADYDLYVLENGGVEQNPDQWWEAMCTTTRKLLSAAGIDKSEINGISFCAQMQAVVLVDRDGNPVRNAMSYMDNRGKKQIEELMHSGLKIAGMNGYKLLNSLRISGAVSGSVKDPVYKYRWVADNEPEVFSKVYKWLDAKDYLVLRASGKFTMSEDSAFSTLLYDTRKGRKCFSSELCKMMKVEMNHLPDIVLSTDNVGGLTEDAARQLGLPKDIPVFSGGGDASLIGVGAGATEDGDTHIYMGTSGWVCTVVNKQKLDVGSMIASIVGADSERFNCFAELETAGKCLEWTIDHIGLDEIGIFADDKKYADDIESKKKNIYGFIMDKIKNVPAGSNGIIFTPWLHGNRNPFEDPDARGVFFGLGIESNALDMIHAVIEGVCMHLKWQMTAMNKLVRASEVIRFVGGGALSELTCQILADVLGKTIETVDDPQNAGSVGAAAVMGVGLGVFDSLQDVKGKIPASAVYEPNKENAAYYEKLFDIFKRLYSNNKKNYRDLRSL